MCNWDTYSFDCGHVEVRPRDRCSKKRTDEELDPCWGTQVVRKEWRYHQTGVVCNSCKRKELETGLGTPFVFVSEEKTMEAAHRAALEMNAARGAS